LWRKSAFLLLGTDSWSLEVCVVKNEGHNNSQRYAHHRADVLASLFQKKATTILDISRFGRKSTHQPNIYHYYNR
jgi:hypothetical protein